MRLEDLRGVGPQLAASLRRHFRDDERLFSALRRLDVQAVAAVDGVSERRALEWIRQMEGVEGDDAFLATPAARRLRDDVVSRIEAFAATEHGRNRLRLLRVLPDPATAAAHAAQVMEAKARVGGLDRDRVRRLLRHIRRPVEPTPRLAADRIVVCENDVIEERLRQAGLHRWVPLTGRGGLRQAESYPLAVVAYEDGMDTGDLENVLEVDGSGDAAEFAPEAVLAWFEGNRSAIEAAAGLAALFGRAHRSGEAIDLLSESARAAATPATLRQAVAEAHEILQADLRRRLAEVQLRGDELMGGTGDRLPAAVRAAVTAALQEARSVLRSRTGHDFQPFTATLPVEVDDAEVERVERHLESLGHRRAFEARVRVARGLAALQDDVRQELAAWLDEDSAFALGCFALHFDLHPARFGDGLRFDSSVHLDLADRSDAQRIAYHLAPPVRAVLLTGANSGGKTTLLEHAAQLVLMARMGLPVVGRDVEVPWVEELLYVTARKGLDAGAFESFLRGFLPVAQGDRRRLVLADEVEAVTELSAASRILAFFLERMAGTGSLALLATHMAPQVLEHARVPEGALRVDGIEASGLDGDGHLVVDRAPRMGHFARSTPELIVQRLALTSRGADQALFSGLLARLQEEGRKGQRKRPASAPP